jgi:DNA-binding beta-propeller fold protein YncE
VVRAILGVLLLLIAAAPAVTQPGSVGAATPTVNEATPSPDTLAVFVGLIGEGVVQQPSGIAIGPDQSIWITDMATDQIHKFGADGTHLLAFGETGQTPGQFEFADFGAVGLDGAGNVYVLDTGNQRVQKFTPDLTFEVQWGRGGAAEGEFLHASEIAVRDDGAVFVVDAMSGRVQEFDSSGGFVREIRPTGIAEEFFEPSRLGLDSEGNLYVPDLTRIYVFDAGGRHIRTVQTNEIDNGELWVGNDAAVSTSGFLYVSDWQASTVVVFDPDGVAVGSWGSRGTEPGQFDEVDALAFDGDGRLLVLDFANRRVQIFSLVEPSSGTPVAAIPQPCCAVVAAA